MGLGGFDAGFAEKRQPGFADGFGSYPQQFPRTAPDMAALIGHTPSNIWLLNEASGNHVDSVGSDPFLLLNSPTQGVATPFAGHRGLRIADGTTQKVYRADNTKFDYDGVTSFAWLLVTNIVIPLSGQRDVLSKRGGQPSYYRAYVYDNSYLYFFGHDGTDFAYAGVDVDGFGYIAILFVVDRDVQKIRIAVPGIHHEGDCTLVDSMTNTGFLSLGAGASLAASADGVYLAHFTGAQAEGMGAAEIDKFWRGV